MNLEGLASGFDTLALLAALRGQPSPALDDSTIRVRTPSGGLHVWYLNPHPAMRFRCSTGSSTKVALAWQVDVRADGGCIVAPTTRTTHGAYLREGPSHLPAPLPEWLGEELVRTGHTIRRPAAARPAIPRSRRSRTPIRAHRVLDPHPGQSLPGPVRRPRHPRRRPLCPVHPRRRRRPAHRPAAQARPHPRLPLPRHQRRPPSRARPRAGTASCTTPSATTPKARK